MLDRENICSRRRHGVQSASLTGAGPGAATSCAYIETFSSACFAGLAFDGTCTPAAGRTCAARGGGTAETARETAPCGPAPGSVAEGGAGLGASATGSAKVVSPPPENQEANEQVSG